MEERTRELPQDPDWDHVPPEGWRNSTGHQVTITAVDRATGELVELPGHHGRGAGGLRRPAPPPARLRRRAQPDPLQIAGISARVDAN